MIRFGSNQNNKPEDKWRWQLDDFARDHQQQLAALAWGLQQEWVELNNILGIDLKPKPHFVACSREAIEKLNYNTNKQLQEILGLIDGYKPEEEVLIIAIGEGQIKLIHFQAEPKPSICFREAGENIDALITSLEASLAAKFIT
ncbi:MAG: hypothetical protein QNJ41_05795 [Xenococcaceae cyanobacterium MO_188.B32]|nr:hypothetical protein [Xenococcaceae cyanobacterium MO_188.B32]